MTTSSENFFVFQTLFQECKLSLKYDFQKINNNPVSKFNHRGHFFFLLISKIQNMGIFLLGFPGGSVIKNPSASAGDTDSIPRSGRYPGEGNGNPL